MVQQNILEEGTFNSTQRNQINDNFSELYQRGVVIGQLTDVTKTSDTTLQDLTGMVQTLEAGIYNFDLNLQIASTTNGGISVAIKSTATIGFSVAITIFTATGQQSSILRNGSGPGIIQLINSSAAAVRVWIVGGMKADTSGTLQIQGAQNTSSVDTTTFYSGGTFIITKGAQST